MEKIGIAFAGFRHGHIFGLYNLVKNDDRFNLVGAFEKDENARTEAEEKGVVFNFGSLEEILDNEETDVIAIGDYYTARGNIAIEGLKHGKHIIADKPLCTSLSEAEEIEKLAMENNKAVGIMLDLRSNKNVAAAIRLIEDGTIGRVNNIIFEGEHPLNYGTRPSWYFEGKQGGTINDIGIHGIDLVRIFTNSNVSDDISARTWNFYAKECPEFKDSAQFRFSTESGAGVIADVSYASPTSHGFTHPSYWHFRIWGEKGLIDLAHNREGIDCYLRDTDEVKHIEGLDVGASWYENWVKALTDEEYRKEFTAFDLETAKQTLKIQSRAD